MYTNKEDNTHIWKNRLKRYWYRENAKRSTGKPVKLAHYIHRLNSKAKSIKYARFSKNETVALDKLHQEIKRLALITYYSNNKNARQILNREILPQLVRVDMEQFDENEAEYLTEDFLKLLRKEYIANVKKNLRNQLNNIDMVNDDGSVENLGEKYGNKKRNS